MKKILVVLAAVIVTAASSQVVSLTIGNENGNIEKDGSPSDWGSINSTFSGGFSLCTLFLLFDWDGVSFTGTYINPEPSTHGSVYFFEDVQLNLSTINTPSGPILGFIKSCPWYWQGFPFIFSFAPTGIIAGINGFTGIIIRIPASSGHDVILGCGMCMSSSGSAWH